MNKTICHIERGNSLFGTEKKEAGNSDCKPKLVGRLCGNSESILFPTKATFGNSESIFFPQKLHSGTPKAYCFPQKLHSGTPKAYFSHKSYIWELRKHIVSHKSYIRELRKHIVPTKATFGNSESIHSFTRKLNNRTYLFL